MNFSRPIFLLLHLRVATANELPQFFEVAELNNFINIGSSQLLLRKDGYDSLSSLLSFEGLSEEYEKQQSEGNAGDHEQKSARYPQNDKIEIKEGEFDEDQNEIKFIKAPKQFKEFSNNLQTILLTNREKSVQFAQSVLLNYEQISVQNEEQCNHILQNIVSTTNYQFIIVDCCAENLEQQKNMIKAVQSLDQILPTLFINVVFDNFLNVEETAQYLNPEFRLNALPDKNSKDILRNILPVQTWSTFKGIEDKELLEANKRAALCVFYDKNGCRQDKFTCLSEIAQKQEELRHLGFSHINSIYLFREITFKLGKLPKYGA